METITHIPPIQKTEAKLFQVNIPEPVIRQIKAAAAARGMSAAQLIVFLAKTHLPPLPDDPALPPGPGPAASGAGASREEEASDEF